LALLRETNSPDVYAGLAAALEAGERVLRWLDMLGLDAAKVGAQLVVTPTGGPPAPPPPPGPHNALELTRKVASNL